MEHARDPNVTFVLVRGQKMRQITKAGGRVLYRVPRALNTAQWWKTKGTTDAKPRKSEKPRAAFRNFARAHNDLEVRVLRKRRMYHRHKKLLDYLRWKLDTPAFLAVQEHRRGHRFDRSTAVVEQCVEPGMNVRTANAVSSTQPTERVRVRETAQRWGFGLRRSTTGALR